MYKHLSNSAAALAAGLSLAFGLAGSSYAEDHRTNKQLKEDISERFTRLNNADTIRLDRLSEGKDADKAWTDPRSNKELKEIGEREREEIANDVDILARRSNGGE